MDAIEAYGDYIKSFIDKNKPETARKLIKLGLSVEEQRTKHFPYKDAPKSLQYLNKICLNYILEPLRNLDNYAWVNLFAPAEILHAMGIHPLLVEAFSSFTSGLKCEDVFIDYAEKSDISETLCGYHKAFIGAVESGVLPKPKFALTSSMVCDANINTFRYISTKNDTPCFTLDVPYEYSTDAENYVAGQLRETVNSIEDITGDKLDEDRLKEILKVENETKNYMKKYFNELSCKYMPSTLTLQMYMLFTSHTFMGRENTLHFYKMLLEDMEKCTRKDGLKVLWVHILPFYNEPLKEYFNFNENYQLMSYDMHFDDLQYMDSEHPYETLAKKMLNNKLNGRFERKLELVMEMVDKLNPDAVINFCHWGCRQSSGGVMLLKEALKNKNIPFLSIDGDGVDRRSGHEGQIRTRLEAFFEIVKGKE